MKQMQKPRPRKWLVMLIAALMVTAFTTVFVSAADTLASDKTEYAYGEDITVTATCSGTKSWVGLYQKGETPGSGTPSIYWYYINPENAASLSGQPVVIQDREYNSNSSNGSRIVKPGEYKLILFLDGGYTNIAATKYITVSSEQTGALELQSITYDLDDPGDGFANGSVTVKRASSVCTDCVLYWADAEGQPLDGYTAIFKHKLTAATTTFDMYDYTIIPEGARKLIAYASDGTNLSESYVAADLPEGASYNLGSAQPSHELQIISDIHITGDGATGDVKYCNDHFLMMLQDVKANSPNSMGIFINGDLANSGQESEYMKMDELYEAAYAGGNLPKLHLGMGNHDWMAGNPDNLFQRYAHHFNPDLGNMPEKVYYTEVVDGIPFIYLSSEEAGTYAKLSDEQLAWFDEQMANYTVQYPDQPVFVFLHQGMYDTVAGTLPGQGWNGVNNEDAFQTVLNKYGQIILLGGHSHWELTSERCMFPGDTNRPVAFNTAAVGYLWSSYNKTAGEYAPGTQGYFVRIYKDKIVFMGRDFENQKFMPSATFVVQKNAITTAKDEYNIPVTAETVPLRVSLADGGKAEFIISDKSIANVIENGYLIPSKVGTITVQINAPKTATHVIDRKTIKVNIVETSGEMSEAAEAAVQLINDLPQTVTIDDQADVETARAAYEALTAEDKAVFPEVALLKLELAEARLGAAQAKAAQETAENELAIAKKTASDAQIEAAQAKADLASLEAQLAQVQADQKAAELEAAEAKAALEKAEIELEKVKNEASDNKAALEKAEAAVAEAKSALANAQNELDALKAANTELQGQLEALEQTQKELQEQLEALAKENMILKIKAKQVKGLKVTPKKTKKAIVQYKSLGKGYKYVIKRSLKKNKGFKTVCTTAKNKVTVKKLKKGKTYYFKVRAYKTIDGKKIYTKYSKVVKVKAK